MDILNEVRSNLEQPYIGDDALIAAVQGCPGLLVTFREFDGALNTQVIAPFETVAPYFTHAFRKDPFTYGDTVAEWTFDNGLVVYVRRLQNTSKGSPSCRVRVENATPAVAVALQEAPQKEPAE